jgi:pectate lyase-like protein
MTALWRRSSTSILTLDTMPNLHRPGADGRLGSMHRVRVATVAAAVALLAACGSPSTPRPTASASPSGAVFNVANYGANGDDTTDNTRAFSTAIAAAQAAGGGTVYVPAGQYAFSATKTGNPSSVVVAGTEPVTLKGAGQNLTYLVEMHQGKGLLGVQVDGSVVEDLTLDTQTHDGGVALYVRANNTRLENADVLGGTRTFAMYYAGPKGAKPLAPLYNSGNEVMNVNLNELDCNDGFSWSFQSNSSITDVHHTGSRLALYIDKNTTVTNYDYTTGAQQCGARNGFWLTPPDSDITIDNFTSNGEGGKVGVIGAGGAGKVAVNVIINNLTLTGVNSYITIGDVRNLVLENCHLGDNGIVVRAEAVAQGTINNCGNPQLTQSSASGAQVSLKVVPA